MKLPKSIEKQIAEAENFEKAIKRNLENHPPAGRPKTNEPIGKKYPVYVEDSEQELDESLAIHAKVIGSKTKGNKRLGNEALYADLIQAFKTLKNLGITLPRNKSLSKKAISHGLGEVFRKHELTTLSDDALMKNSPERQRIANANNGIFERVASQID
jgi:hypothetical protein